MGAAKRSVLAHQGCLRASAGGATCTGGGGGAAEGGSDVTGRAGTGAGGAGSYSGGRGGGQGHRPLQQAAHERRRRIDLRDGQGQLVGHRAQLLQLAQAIRARRAWASKRSRAAGSSAPRT